MAEEKSDKNPARASARTQLPVREDPRGHLMPDLFSSGQDEILGEAEDPSAIPLCPHLRCLVVAIGLKVPRFLDLATVDVRENRCTLADPFGYFIARMRIEITPALHGRDSG
jgi:hypothetical protein